MNQEKFERKMRKHLKKLERRLSKAEEYAEDCDCNDCFNAARHVRRAQRAMNNITQAFDAFVAENPAPAAPAVIPESLVKPFEPLLGQRVIANGRIGTACVPPSGAAKRPGYIWVAIPVVGSDRVVPTEFGANNVQPLPGGQL